MRKKYASVDLLRFVFAIIVVGIHTEPFSFSFLLDNGFGLISRVAVPYFFLSSAYFLFLKYDFETKDNRVINAFLKRIIILYLVWSAIYFPISFWIYLKSESNFIDWILSYSFNFLINGSFIHLWFLPNIIIGIILTILLLRVLKVEHVFYISIIIYIIGTLISTYEPIFINIIPKWLERFVDIFGTRNGLFYGFPLSALGALLASYQEKIFFRGMKFWIIGFFLSFGMLGIEGIIAVLWINTTSTILWIALILATLSIFQISLRYNVLNFDTSFFRKSSVLIYTSHYLFIYLFKRLFQGYEYGNIILFIIVTISSILFSYIIYIIQKRFQMLKFLS